MTNIEKNNKPQKNFAIITIYKIKDKKNKGGVKMNENTTNSVSQNNNQMPNIIPNQTQSPLTPSNNLIPENINNTPNINNLIPNNALQTQPIKQITPEPVNVTIEPVQQPVNTINPPSTQSIELQKNIPKSEEEILRNPKKRKKGPHIFFLFLELLIVGAGIYLFMQENEKDKTYKTIGADLFLTEKVYKAGKPYYKARYTYKIKNKKYYYNYPGITEQMPDQIIQVKYNPQNPSDIYTNNMMIITIIIISIGVISFFITIGILISISSANQEKIVTAVVEDILTCVGGRKIYLRNNETPVDPNNPNKTEYYSYYTTNYKNFPIGRVVKFNAYKYNEVLTTENYKNNFTAMEINNFKTEDFIILK